MGGGGRASSAIGRFLARAGGPSVFVEARREGPREALGGGILRSIKSCTETAATDAAEKSEAGEERTDAEWRGEDLRGREDEEAPSAPVDGTSGELSGAEDGTARALFGSRTGGDGTARATEGRSRNDALRTGAEDEELSCEAAEKGEGVTALAVLRRVSSLAQCETDSSIAQCEADSLSINASSAKISAQQPDGDRGKAKRRALDALIFFLRKLKCELPV